MSEHTSQQQGDDRPFKGRQVVSFVRRGSRLQGPREEYWERHADDFVIDVPRLHSSTSVHPDFRLDPEAEYGRTAPLTVEIGSGLGEAIAARAQQQPERDFLAVEVYVPGIAGLLGRIGNAGLTNVRAVNADAVDVLSTMIEPGSVDEVWTFFSDPWPKTKHHKRRLVQPEFAAIVAKALRPGGTWRLATDWQDYAEQMLEVTGGEPAFENPHGGFSPRFDGRILTSFERKGIEAGREIFDLELRRR